MKFLETVQTLWQWSKKQKLRFVAGFVSILLFSLLLFPFNDLGDLVSAEIAKMTNNQVFLQFDEMSIQILPQPGLTFQNLYTEAMALPPLTSEFVSISPSISGLLSFKPGVTVRANGFMEGDLILSTKGGDKTKEGTLKQEVSLQMDAISLKNLKNFASLPMELLGALGGDANLIVDPTFGEQPEAELNISIDRFVMPPGTVPTMMGPLALPEIKISKIELIGRLSEGNFILENIILGENSDQISGTIKGDMGLKINMRGEQIQPRFGSYNFTLDLNIRESFEQKAKTFLSFLDRFRSASPNGARYALKLSGSRFGVPPRMSPVR